MSPVVSETLDLANTQTLLATCLTLVRELDGVNAPTGNTPGRADLKRDLLYLADTCERAGAETRAVYHALNGRGDPLEEQ